MAGFIDVKMAPVQFRQPLGGKSGIMSPRSKTYSISKSIHYANFLCFEGIRFFVRKTPIGLDIVFLNLEHNLNRFRKSMTFYLSREQEKMLPNMNDLEDMISYYFRHKKMRPFLEEMAREKKYGYLRPYTLDEGLSIGVDFPSEPTIRMIVGSFTGYLGEPFTGVVVPDLVRAVRINGTGYLKLGINYPFSIRAIRLAREVDPEAKAALMLDDKFWMPPEERNITEWDSSCALFGLADGSVISIPDGPLILPSVTIKGILSILREMDVNIDVRNMKYAELIDLNERGELSVVASVGTAGVLNRCEKLELVSDGGSRRTHTIDKNSEIYSKLAEAKEKYLAYYISDDTTPDNIKRTKIHL